MKTTKIVVEEASASPEICGTFTFSQSSRKSEICVEEVASYSLNAPFGESFVSDHKETLLSAVIEENESDHDLGRKMSRGISIVSCSEDEKIIEKEEAEAKDDEMEILMKRIQKQRSVLDNIITKEATKVEEAIVTKKDESLKADVSEIVAEAENEDKLTNGETEKENKNEDKPFVEEVEAVEEAFEIQEVRTEEVQAAKQILNEDMTEDVKISETSLIEAEEKKTEEKVVAEEEKLLEEDDKTSTEGTKQVENLVEETGKSAENSTAAVEKVPEKLVEEEVVAKEEAQPEGIPTNPNYVNTFYHQFSKTGMKTKIY